ncbi:MAG: hypothetical protein GF404_10990 [candidate division Zixibacteria bacterium]|nr:hypothetical protein [candidate division Zixibacteria bacterium]
MQDRGILAMTDYQREILVGLTENAGLDSRQVQMLLARFKTLEDLLAADHYQLTELHGIDEDIAHTITSLEHSLENIRDQLHDYTESGIHTMTILDPDYPDLLRETSDPPFVLYYRGNFPLQSETFIAFAGSSHATAEGLAISVNYGKALADTGAVIVSGLSRGVDTSAHLGAIKADGRSYAVLGCGFNHIYPSENERLAEELLEKGALISEYPPDTEADDHRLLMRNRIIVGLSHSLVLGEIDRNSKGTIDTAERAKNLGKLTFAIGDKDTPIDPGLVEYGAIPIEDISQADMIARHSF